ncbi:MAG: hypothetical protein COT84_05165 [Chlamydiae bacterium CG10_big_fil_rev_8_21_14_0_10_35_9]|nr:MAG: hypothetical protein COT84_05165 [Chlamydiae bacterium CG10_big_fil_rev_8_21_14_0_10_35_9]
MNEIRKKWLISFVIISTFTFVQTLFMQGSIFKLVSIVLLSFGAITYYLGYKKQGTTWLSLVIGVRAISVSMSFMQISYLLFTKQFSSTIEAATSFFMFSPKVYAAFWIGGVFIGAYYTYNCYRLKKMNNQQKNAA